MYFEVSMRIRFFVQQAPNRSLRRLCRGGREREKQALAGNALYGRKGRFSAV
jgi:hypothetical protein